jgi:peptidoglycan hydrolase-like protein with peptidoglycan-binding domain
VRIWEKLRDLDVLGYAPASWLIDVEGWHYGTNGGATCSPFTAMAIAMAFDPREDPVSPVRPVLANGEPLPLEFCRLHNGRGSGPANGSARSCVYYNLGRFVDPKHMRRGDLVAISWTNGGGHAVFVWDVHLDANGEVDCFQYVSSNGSYVKHPSVRDERGNLVPIGGQYGGVTVSGGAYLLENRGGPKYIERRYQHLFPDFRGQPNYRKKVNPYFADDDDQHDFCGRALWNVLPGVDRSRIDRRTFRPGKTPHFADSPRIGRLEVVRFFYDGEPPEPWASPGGRPSTPPPPPSHAQAEPVTVPGAEVARDPERVRREPPQRVEQREERPTEGQLWVEERLLMLFRIGWIRSDPGQPDNVNDARTQAAIREFQQRNGLRVDGIAGRHTKRKLREVIARARREVPNFDAVIAGGEPPAPPGETAPGETTPAAPAPGSDATPASTQGSPPGTGSSMAPPTSGQGGISPAPSGPTGGGAGAGIETGETGGTAQTEHAGPTGMTPPPSAGTPAPVRPAVEAVYWRTGSARPGEQVTLIVRGMGIDGASFEVSLETPAGSADAGVRIAVSGGKGRAAVRVPAACAAGKASGSGPVELRARVRGAGVEAVTEAPLYVFA